MGMIAIAISRAAVMQMFSRRLVKIISSPPMTKVNPPTRWVWNQLSSLERPVDAYAEDHVLGDLGHDVSKNHKQDSQENGDKQRKVELDVQGEHDDASHDEYGDGGNEPYDVGEVLSDLAVLLELNVCVQEAK